MKFFISDLHLGCGDALDDFILRTQSSGDPDLKKKFPEEAKAMHRAFSRFADYIVSESASCRSNPELVFLGDSFDLLQALPEKRCAPEKIELIYSAHKEFFHALHHLRKNGVKITFILGNHDHDLLYPEMFSALKKALPFANEEFGGEPRLSYSFPDARLYAEHGNQFDFLNSFRDPYDPDEWPFGSELIYRFINPFEHTCPMIDNFGVREALWYALRHSPEIISAAQKKELMLYEAVLSLSKENRLKHLAWFLMHQLIPTHDSSVFKLLWRLLAANERLLRSASARRNTAKGILYTFRNIGRNPLRVFQNLLMDRLSGAAAEIMKGETESAIGAPPEETKYVLFGHTHRPLTKRPEKGKKYVNTGSWRLRAVPWKRFSFRLEQTLDFAVAYRNSRGEWKLKRKSWRDMMK